MVFCAPHVDYANYLYLPPAMNDKFIYRIVSCERLFDLFASKQNVLVKPKKWEDPFENFILKCRIQVSDGTYANFGFQNDFYGQCWTLQSTSDAMWRIYSPDSTAVRIRSTIRKLADSLSRYSGDWAPHEVFVGRVQYLTIEELEKFARGTLRSAGGSLSMRMFAKTLLVKRKAFKHEREVRLIFKPRQKSKAKRNLFRYLVDPNELLVQIMIDPRMPAREADDLKLEIKSRTGFGGKMIRSLLYAPPPIWTIPL